MTTPQDATTKTESYFLPSKRVISSPSRCVSNIHSVRMSERILRSQESRPVIAESGARQIGEVLLAETVVHPVSSVVLKIRYNN